MAGEDGQDAGDELSVLRARNEALEATLQEVRDGSDRRAIQAELRSEATRRGMIDLDGLKLIEGSEVTIDEQGVVHGVAPVLTKLRRDKPWLFGATSSSSAAGVPVAVATRSKLATEMTLAEWRTARAELLRRS